ncbi:MAG: hypothetical protein J6W99_04460 [Bacteroidaceae bacterium]|nr:hypothetical protein [Bacteroidaceae bacterium]
MKKSIFLLLALMAAVISCDKIETDDENKKDATEQNDSIQNDSIQKIDTLYFSGVLTANASSGDCITPDTKISVNYTDKADSVSITIFKAKLAQRMPAMDIIIPGISVKQEGDVTEISSDNSIPLAMGSEFPAYTVTEFSGFVLSDSISFSLKFGQTPTSFAGHIQMQ